VDRFEHYLNAVNSFVWGTPTLILLIGTGVWMSIVLCGIQFRVLPHALRLSFGKSKNSTTHVGDISHFQALMAAISATVGVGNIAGVATAIATGGPGAMFWMWCTGLVGMATKYAEAVLSVHFRVTAADGTMSGGPMYYISRGLGQRWMAVLFAIFTVFASFGIGNMVQSNTIAVTLAPLNFHPWVMGGIIAGATALVVLGGIKTLGNISALLTPVMIGIYFVAVAIIIALNIQTIPSVFTLIFVDAFTPTAAVGGFAGATVKTAMQMGIARGLFSNEAGLGSSPIMAAAAKTSHPAEPALVSMLQVFIDTIIVCSLTGFAILCTDAWKTGQNGVELTNVAFAQALGPIGRYVVSVSVVFFAYTTLISWGYFGEQALRYLIGQRGVKTYRVIFIIVVFLGAQLKINVVWTLSDIFNGLMAFPNLIALLCLTPIVLQETKHYLAYVRDISSQTKEPL